MLLLVSCVCAIVSKNIKNLLTGLLFFLGFINPVILVDKIKMGVQIPELKRSLIKMLCDYSLQVSITDGCNKILERDYFSLHQKLYKCQQKAVSVSDSNICGLCSRDIFVKGK